MSSSDPHPGLGDLLSRVPMYVHRCRQHQMTEEEIVDDLNAVYGGGSLRFTRVDTTRLTPDGEYPMEFSFAVHVALQEPNPLVRASE